MDFKFDNGSEIKTIESDSVIRGQRSKCIAKMCYDETLCPTPEVNCVDCPVFKSL